MMKSSTFQLVVPITLLTLVTLTACDSSITPPQGESIRPVKTLIVGTPGMGGERRFPARIESARRVELAFRVPGTLQKLPVKEGEEVKAGTIIAQLDPADFQTAVDDRKAVFTRTSADYERAKELIKDGFISRVDYDKVEADYKSAKAALRQAEQELSYTTLRAPYSGNVAARYVQNFEEVQAKQPIIALRDLTLLDVKFNVPESLVISLSEQGIEDESQDIPVYASFDAAPDTRYWLSYKEAATRADPKTQTFEVTYTLPAPDELEVLPGMTTTVTIDVTRYLGRTTVFTIPASAVIADPGLQPKVWIVEPETMTVSAREIKVGSMEGINIRVLSGLEGGERIVIAGAPYLVEGMKVRLLPDHEQATDNLPRETVRTAPEVSASGTQG